MRTREKKNRVEWLNDLIIAIVVIIAVRKTTFDNDDKKNYLQILYWLNSLKLIKPFTFYYIFF